MLKNNQMRIVLMVVLFMLCTVSVRAEEVDATITTLQNKSEGDVFIFEIGYNIEKVSKGDTLTIEMPFNTKVDGGGIVDVVTQGNKHILTFNDDYINVRGKIGGKQELRRGESLPPVVINGEAQAIDYNLPNTDVGEGTEATREPIYKQGVLMDNGTIRWIVNVSGGNDHLYDAKIHDVVGDGHEIMTDTVRFGVQNPTTGIHTAPEDVLTHIIDKNITAESISVHVQNINHGEYFTIEYYTRITDESQGSYSNQLLVEGQEKISETVVTQDWSEIEADKPEPNTPPTEPEEPNIPPIDPEEPLLPQVGELFLKPEYVAGMVLVIVALVLKQKGKGDE